MTWCNTSDQGQLVYTNTSCPCGARPKKVDGQGLFDCLAAGLLKLGIQGSTSAEHCKHLVGMGTDVAAAGLKGLVRKAVPWLY